MIHGTVPEVAWASQNAASHMQFLRVWMNMVGPDLPRVDTITQPCEFFTKKLSVPIGVHL